MDLIWLFVGVGFLVACNLALTGISRLMTEE